MTDKKTQAGRRKVIRPRAHMWGRAQLKERIEECPPRLGSGPQGYYLTPEGPTLQTSDCSILRSPLTGRTLHSSYSCKAFLSHSCTSCSKMIRGLRHLGGSVVEHLPSAQGVTLGSPDRVPHRAPCKEPASPSACVSASLSLCLSRIDKYKIFKKKG